MKSHDTQHSGKHPGTCIFRDLQSTTLERYLIRLIASNKLSAKIFAQKCQQIPQVTFFTTECGDTRLLLGASRK